MRWVSTRVLPDPGPATTSTGPLVASTASRCASLSPLRSSVAMADVIESKGGGLLRTSRDPQLGREKSSIEPHHVLAAGLLRPGAFDAPKPIQLPFSLDLPT